LDENDGKQTPAIVELLTRMKMKLPEGLEEKGKVCLNACIFQCNSTY
jgi:ubiquitin C-terminal hydrolase